MSEQIQPSKPASNDAPLNATVALKRLHAHLGIRAEYYRTKTDDPCNINTALYVAMLEVQNAVRDAIGGAK